MTEGNSITHAHNFKNLSGREFGKLTVTNEHERRITGRQWKTFWKCLCSCGNETWVVAFALLRPKNGIKSCGCNRRIVIHGQCSGIKEGRSRLYKIWQNMKERIDNPACERFDIYGGRGISLCTEWRDPKVFFDWALANGYQNKLEIDRRDNDG